MTTDSINDIERDAKRADKLAVGDYILEDSSGVDEPHKVLAAVPCRDGDRRPVIAALLLPPAGAPTHTVHYREDKLVDLATESEVAEMVDEARRHEVVEGLRDLISLIRTQRIRFSPMGPAASFTVAQGEAERLAAALDLQPNPFGVADAFDVSVQWTAPTGDERGFPLHATFWGRQAPEKPAEAAVTTESGPPTEAVGIVQFHEAEPEQEWLFTFGAGQEHDGRFVRIRGTEMSTRKEMNRVFGHAWCAQYDWRRFDEEGLPARVTELPEYDWPAHAEVGHHARLDGTCWSSCPTCHPEAVEVPSQQAGE